MYLTHVVIEEFYAKNKIHYRKAIIMPRTLHVMVGFDRQRTAFTAWDLVRLRLTAVTRAPKLPPEASFPPVTLSGPNPTHTVDKAQKNDTLTGVIFCCYYPNNLDYVFLTHIIPQIHNSYFCIDVD
jgi:hypothetical protein